MGYIFKKTALIYMRHLIIILLIFSCIPDDYENFIQPELQEYYNNFLIEAENRNIQLPDKSVLMYIDDIPGYNGLTYKRKNSIKIIISKEAMSYSKGYDYRIESTIFHELGHGFLNREHVEENSIMNINRDKSVYLENREFYINELFGI